MEDYLSPRQKKILQFLQEKETWVKGNELAVILGVTVRTVRTDIREMMPQLKKEELFIESSNVNGYRLLGKQSIVPKIKQQKEQTPILPAERLNFIMKELIRGRGKKSVYDLAEMLMVSESTVENDLKKIRAYLEHNAADTHLTRKGEYIMLVGSERSHRALFSQLLFTEADGTFLGLSNYETYFPEIKKVQQLLLSCLKKYAYSLNEMAIINIIVHIAIMLDRMKKMRFLSHASSLAEYTDAVEFQMAEELCAVFNEEFNVALPPQERLYLMYLLMTKKQSRNACDNQAELADFIMPVNLEAAEFMVEGVRREFGLDLRQDETFFIGFALHMQALCERVKHHGVIRNPLLGELKRRYPFVFEIAVFMADCFKQQTGNMIVEDEIGFITLHLGAALERFYEQNVEVKRVALVCPSGSTSTEMLLGKLYHIYQNKIEIVGVFSFFALAEIEAAKPDFIFATVNFEHDLTIPTIVISPFLDFRDIELVNKNLNLWEHTAKKQKLRTDMTQYFSADVFFDNVAVADHFALLGYMADKLTEAGFVPPEYKESVLERERISSTSFAHLIAIPHAIVMNAHKTVVSVARFDKPISWGEYKVQLVLLFAIKQGERKKLSDLYRYILQIVDQQEGVQYLAQAKNCAGFQERILNWT